MGKISYNEWKKKVLLSAREKRAFVSCQFELTGRCNLDCKMCYVHALDHCAAKEKELSTEEWKKAFDDAYNMGMLFATLTGGECLLRPDFKELYLHLWKKRVMVAVLTNGILLNEEYVEFFKQYRPEHIQISLYGTTEDGYLQVTGHKGFERTVFAIQSLKEAGIDVRVAVTPSKYIKEDYIDTIKYCRDHGFNTKFAEMVLVPNRENPEKNDYYLSQDEIVELSVQRTEIYQKIQSVEQTPEPRGEQTAIAAGLDCNAGNCLCTVTWDGKIYPCPNALIGGYDVRELGFAEAWERTKAAAARVLLPAECTGCAYEKICVRCPVSRSPKLDGHCDPAVCEMTRRLVAAGVKKLDMPTETDPEHG